MLHRPHFFTSKALVITTTGGVGGGAAAKSIVNFLYGIGFNRCYSYAKASFSWNAYVPNDKTFAALNRKVKKFYKDILSQKLHSPSTRLLILYNLFRGMSLAYVPGTNYETEDGIYWTQESRRKKVYMPEVNVTWWKRPIGHMFYLVGKVAGSMKRMTVTYKK